MHGRAAHGSRYDIGVDAIRHAGLLLAELDALDDEELPRRATHPLLGRGVAARVADRRRDRAVDVPGPVRRCGSSGARSPASDERARRPRCEAACARVRARRPTFDADVTLDFAQPPSDVAADAPIVRALVDALGAAGEAASPLEGMSAWTDAALLNAAGIPAICFGPGDIALAHAAHGVRAGRRDRARRRACCTS